MEKHPSEKLVLYISGELLPDEQEVVTAHLRGCNSCRSELEELKAGDILLSLYGRVVNSKEACLMPEKLSQFVDNSNINDTERDGIKHHISQCSDCRNQIELLMQLDKDMLTDITEESSNIVPLLPDYLRSSIRKKYPKVIKKLFFPAIHAATILIVIGFFLWFFKFNPVPEPKLADGTMEPFIAQKPVTLAPKSKQNIAPKSSRHSGTDNMVSHNEPKTITPNTPYVEVQAGRAESTVNSKISKTPAREPDRGGYSLPQKLGADESGGKAQQMKNLADGRNFQNYQAPIALEEKTSSLSSSKTEGGYDTLSPKTVVGVAKSIPGESQSNYRKQNILAIKKADELRTIDKMPQMIEEELKTVFALASVNVEVLIKDIADDKSYIQNDADQAGSQNNESKHFEKERTDSKIEQYGNLTKDKKNKVREILVVTSEPLTKEKQESIRKYLNTFVPLNPLVDQVRFAVRHQ